MGTLYSVLRKPKTPKHRQSEGPWEQFPTYPSIVVQAPSTTSVDHTPTLEASAQDSCTTLCATHSITSDPPTKLNQPKDRPMSNGEYYGQLIRIHRQLSRSSLRPEATATFVGESAFRNRQSLRGMPIGKFDAQPDFSHRHPVGASLRPLRSSIGAGNRKLSRRLSAPGSLAGRGDIVWEY